MTAINGQVYGIDPSLESAHFITDILSHDSKLFLISQDGNQDNSPSTLRCHNSEGKPSSKLVILCLDISRKSSESSQPIWEIATSVDRKVCLKIQYLFKIRGN